MVFIMHMSRPVPEHRAHRLVGGCSGTRYGCCDDGGPDLRNRLEEFEDWYVDVQFANESLRVLCCPEDRTCSDAACMERPTCCFKCRVPVCRECTSGMGDKNGRPSMPAPALVNDMMIFYAPRELYTKQVTILEMICASVCFTSMICFALEKKISRPASVRPGSAHATPQNGGARKCHIIPTTGNRFDDCSR